MASIQGTSERPCHLLALPTELRNRIYQLVAAHFDGRSINLYSARPPGEALLHTCRQILEEASALFERAARNFWSSTHFVADVGVNTHDEVVRVLDRLGPDTIGLITRLRVRGSSWNYGIVWELKNRIWSYGHRPNGTNVAWMHYLVVNNDPNYRRICGEGVPRIEENRVSVIVVTGLAQDRLDEAKQCYGSAALTRHELEKVMICCAEDWSRGRHFVPAVTRARLALPSGFEYRYWVG